MTSDDQERFGSIGIWSSALHQPGATDAAAVADAVAELDELGYGTIWIGGSPSVEQVRPVIDASSRITVATGIMSIWQHEAASVAARFAELEKDAPGRFVLGLGVSHDSMTPQYARPYSAMVAYLDALDAAPVPVPASRRVLAALGPKMLRLAAERSLGAHPYLVTVEHTAQAREGLGPDALLAPELMVVLDTDLDRARTTARTTLARYLALPNYTGNLLRLGFTEDDFAGGGSERLLDALFALGDVESAVARVDAYRGAGADHVALQVLTAEDGQNGLPRAEWRALASALSLK